MPHGQDNYLLTKIISAIPCKGRQTARVLSSRVCGWNGSAFHSSTWLKGVQIRPVMLSSKIRPIHPYLIFEKYSGKIMFNKLDFY